MITKLTMQITSPEGREINTNMSSLLHGYLINNMDDTYAHKMHESTLRPFSQYISRKGNGWQWVVSTLTDEAEEYIIKPLMRASSLELNHNGMTLELSEHELVKTSFDKLFVGNYISGESSRIVQMRFVTPTSFKSNGKYLNYPMLKLIFSSLIKKYDSNSETTSLYDDKLIDQLLECTEVIGYNLRSTLFHLEGVKIPSFIGSIKIKVRGNSNMVSLVNMLAEFALYSGVGIKCAIGMGGIGVMDDTNYEMRGKGNER